MAKTAGHVAALAYENLSIAVSVFDVTGQKFDNISTFDIRSVFRVHYNKFQWCYDIQVPDIEVKDY